MIHSLVVIAILFYPIYLPSAVIDWKGSEHHILKEFDKTFKAFSKKVCTPGTEFYFNALLKKYRGKGHFVPMLPGGKLDTETIKKYLPELERKLTFIQAQSKNLEQVKEVVGIEKDISDLRLMLGLLLQYKQRYFEVKENEDLDEVKKNATRHLQDFKIKFRQFTARVPFFLGYGFPVDHFRARYEYDRHKALKDLAAQKKANEIYFLRKIHEDGAPDPKYKSSDFFFRTAFNTVYINLEKEQDFISEDIRFDMEYILNQCERIFARGLAQIRRRFQEWEQKTHEQIAFYNSILSDQIEEDGKIMKGDELVSFKMRTRDNLANFILSKYISTFEFWTKQSELINALFVLDTILMNEVGPLDGEDAQERRDIIQVVFNRLVSDKYNKLGTDESLYMGLLPILGDKIDDYKWLNLLFKRGEFSFTYFYMSASVRVFCPSMARTARYLRKQNIRIALELLKNPNHAFEAIRYFSRASMTGRINMTQIWDDYLLLPERPGKRLDLADRLKHYYQKGDYDFLYLFEDDQSVKYRVIKIHDQNYVMTLDGENMFKHRSPHMFKYFKPKVKPSK